MNMYRNLDVSNRAKRLREQEKNKLRKKYNALYARKSITKIVQRILAV